MDLQTELLLNATGTWSREKREEFEERAAIREFDGKMTRANAELVTFQQMMRAEKK